MWGSFNDIAKKAQELQQQANQAASTLSTSSPFNLDAMQQQTAAKQAQQAKKTLKPPPPTEQAARPVMQPAVISMDAFSTPLPSKPVITTKGKLQVPTPPSLANKKQPARSPPSSPLRTPSSPSQAKLVVNTNNSTTPDTAVEKPTKAKVQSPMHAQETDKYSLPPPSSSVSSAGERLAEKQSPSEEASNTSVPIANAEEPGNNNKTIPSSKQASSEEIVNEENRLPQHTDVSSSNHHPPKADDASKDERNNKDIQQQPQQSLVILVSTLSQKSINLQETVFATLKIKKVPYEMIDAIDPDPMYKELRNDLMAISHLKVFPQFFHVNLSNGKPTFWGTYERFQNANDDGILKQELLMQPAKKDQDSHDEPTNDVGTSTGVTSPKVTDTVAETDPKITDKKKSEQVDTTNSDRMMEQFSEQMKRVEENHLAEMMEIESQHALALANAQASAMDHSACEADRQELEDRLKAQIRQQENTIHELMRVNEGYQLKMDVLKREVAGTQALLAEKDSDMGKANDTSSRAVTALEEKLRKAEEGTEKVRQYNRKIEQTLETTKGELGASKSEHSELKARVKGVAAELKERRSECRELHAKVDNLSRQKQKLEGEIEDLQYQLTHQHQAGSARNDEMEQLQSKLVDATTEIEKLRKVVAEKDSKSEKALTEYKRKAQSSLALANSRTAAAVQAKEEAELDARAARSAADTAMERAVKAEIDSKAKAKEMEVEKDAALKEAKDALSVLKANEAKLTDLQTSLEDVSAVENRKTQDLETARAELTTERAKTLSLEKETADAKIRINILRDDVSSLREQLRHAEATIRSMPTSSEEPEHPQTIPKPTTKHDNASISTDQETVAILQQELRDANAAIEDLKEALKNAVEQSEQANGRDSGPSPPTNGPTEPAPLFYAMEKQAELNTARSEINRLASLLSDAQSEKMEAIESTEEMRKRMQEAEARLRRYEKLGRSRGPNGGGRNSTAGKGPEQADSIVDSGAVNIEYLKNIMLRYLSAKTIAERKALVPVIGAVLCLTPGELQKALASLDESSSIGGVGNSIFESISGTLLSK